MHYCIYCGQQLPDDAFFCQKCGKATKQAKKELTNQLEESACTIQGSKEVSIISAPLVKFNPALVEVAVGVAALVIMIMFGAISSYPNVYVMWAVDYNTAVLFWYAIFYGFAIQATSTLRQEDGKIDVKRGIGGAISGLLVSIPGYLLYFIGNTGGNHIPPMLWLLVASLIIPIAKSVQFAVGSNFRFIGISELKRNLTVGIVSGIVGFIVVLTIDALFRHSNLYTAFGAFGFVSYLLMLQFAKPKNSL